MEVPVIGNKGYVILKYKGGLDHSILLDELLSTVNFEPSTINKGGGKFAVEKTIRSCQMAGLYKDNAPHVMDTCLAHFHRAGSILLQGTDPQEYHLPFISLLKYDTPGDFYTWHTDSDIRNDPNGDLARRKLSLVWQISPSNDYSGCELLLEDNYKNVFKFTKDTGNIIIFNSSLRHTVTPLIEGTRYCIVAWLEKI